MSSTLKQSSGEQSGQTAPAREANEALGVTALARGIGRLLHVLQLPSTSYRGAMGTGRLENTSPAVRVAVSLVKAVPQLRADDLHWFDHALTSAGLRHLIGLAIVA